MDGGQSLNYLLDLNFSGLRLEWGFVSMCCSISICIWSLSTLSFAFLSSATASGFLFLKLALNFAEIIQFSPYLLTILNGFYLGVDEWLKSLVSHPTCSCLYPGCHLVNILNIIFKHITNALQSFHLIKCMHQNAVNLGSIAKVSYFP